MVTRNEAIRQLKTAIYRSAIEEAAEGFAIALLTDETLPPLRLTALEFEQGAWPIAGEYESLILRIMAEIVVNHQYELSDIQLRGALIRGAERADRLVVEGTPSPSKKPALPSLIVRTGRRFNWLHYDVPE